MRKPYRYRLNFSSIVAKGRPGGEGEVKSKAFLGGPKDAWQGKIKEVVRLVRGSGGERHAGTERDQNTSGELVFGQKK